jgi:Uncharacterized protein conserved in bacteria (DUF2252)
MTELTVVTFRTAPSQPRPAPRSPAELMADGKWLRDTVLRPSHGAWETSAERPDPIALLQSLDSERLLELVPVRYGRMLVSPFTYYRGAANVMAADTSTSHIGFRCVLRERRVP